MSEILNKISSYNIINYIIPGGIFYYIFSEIEILKIDNSNLLTQVFLIYFIGMTLSRIGSILIEPILIKAGFLKTEPYKNFLNASSKDVKIEILMESSALYRTLFTGFLFVFLYRIFASFLRNDLTIFESVFGNNNWLILILGALYLFSYLKQVGYVRKRIQNYNAS